jgi:hypothetical protein
MRDGSHRIHDASDAVHDRVKRKLLSNHNHHSNPVLSASSSGTNHDPHVSYWRERVAQIAAKMASDVVTAQQVATKVGTKLCRDIPRKLSQKGITATVELVFQEGGLVVLQLQVTHVDAIILAQAKQKVEENSCSSSSIVVTWVRWILCLIGLDNKDVLEKDYLPSFVTSQLTEFLKPAMEKMIAEKNLKAEADIMSEKDQARFFFQLLTELRATKEAEKQEKRKVGPLLLSSFGKKSDSDITGTSGHSGTIVLDDKMRGTMRNQVSPCL